MSRDLFVIMPFGPRQHPSEPAVTVDFDLVYREIIKPAAENAGWTATRIDEESFIGDIAHRFIERLFQAELVLADVSVPNANVFYELGIRHGIASGGTMLVAHEGIELPFDIRNERTLFYSLGLAGLVRSRTALTEAFKSYEPTKAMNPVRSYLERVGAASNPTNEPARFESEFSGRVDRASSAEQVHAVWNWAKHQSPLPLSPLLRLARRFGEANDWASASEALRVASSLYPEDYEVHRQLAWSLRKLDAPPYAEVVAEFRKALALNPSDPEALGMLGGVYKRLQQYSEAKRCYDEAAELAPSSEYVLVNQAAMAIFASPKAPETGVGHYRALLKSLEKRQGAADVWGALVAGEAAFAVGDQDAAAEWFGRARQLSTDPVPFESAADQLTLFAHVGFQTEAAAHHSRSLREHVDRLQGRLQRPASAKAATAAGAKPPVLIHLSDLHFGSRPGKEPAPMHRFGDGDYNEPLIRHLERQFKGPQASFSYDADRLHLIVSGDLTYSADSSEFRTACEFLVQMSGALGISRERVHLVPGNHDVHWPSSAIHPSHRFDNYIGFLDDFYGSTLLRARYPFLRWDLRTNSQRDAPASLLSLYAADQVVVVGLNSCVYETDQNHFGFVGGRQMKLVDDWLLGSNVALADGAVRVAVIHHHLHPFPEPITEKRGPEELWQDLSTIRDAGLVERALELRGFDLVLHGHKHHAQLRETLIKQQPQEHRAVSRLIVCGCGSTGVARTELEHGDGNHFEVIELLQVPRHPGSSFAKVHWRELAYRADAQWRTTDEWTIDG